MPLPINIVIEVKGGNIQHVQIEDPEADIRLLIVDRDNQECGEGGVSEYGGDNDWDPWDNDLYQEATK